MRLKKKEKRTTQKKSLIFRGRNREKWEELQVCKSLSNLFRHSVPSAFSLQMSPPERQNRFISCEFIEVQSAMSAPLRNGESNYWKPPAPFFIFIDKVALCWSWQQVQSSAPHDSRQRWLSIRNGIFVWSQNHCLSLNLSKVDANEASGSVRLAKKKINNSAPPALQYN